MAEVMLKKPYTREDYIKFAIYCNSNGYHIENKGFYLKAVKNPEYVPTYRDKRAAEYPAISEQLDMMYWDKVNGTNNWQENIAEIKAKYPKDEA